MLDEPLSLFKQMIRQRQFFNSINIRKHVIHEIRRMDFILCEYILKLTLIFKVIQFGLFQRMVNDKLIRDNFVRFV